MAIQIDMFEVQLGSAMLMQFKLDDEKVVRVLADAGIKEAEEYSRCHVHRKLDPAFNEFHEQKKKRIDLIIGTHYDKDHLHGLVPIIKDTSIEIGEAWLPPVANDTETVAEEDTPDISRMLAVQFSQEDGKKQLSNYLQSKARICERIRKFEEKVATINTENIMLSVDDLRALVKYAENLKKQRPDQPKNWFEDPNKTERYFESHLEETFVLPGTGERAHNDLDITDPNSDVVARAVKQAQLKWMRFRPDEFEDHIDSYIAPIVWPENVLPVSASLSFIRRAAATDAINAKSLYCVVEALNNRKIPIRSEIIPNGSPRRYAWCSRKERFVPCARLQSNGPILTLLGPSEGLVQKHWKRLPVGMYLRMAELSRMPIKSITPSNQLSYVVKLQFEGQAILVTGDAGCVDFKPVRGRKYYRNLLKELSLLHVIQVAHHAGNNAHFYRVLERAGYAKQTVESYLLLSHGTDDMHRPSDEFRLFVGNIRPPDDNLKLLFTSRPSADKVQDFGELIAPVVGQSCGKLADRGDVRLLYSGGNWQVKEHAVKV